MLRTIARGERIPALTPDPAIVALQKALEQRLDDLADEATEMIVAEVPAYRRADEQLRADVRTHILSHLRASRESLGADRGVTREDLLFVRPHAAQRAKAAAPPRSAAPSGAERRRWPSCVRRRSWS